MKNKNIKNQIEVLVEESKLNMPDDLRKQCHRAIHMSSLASAGVGAGLAQLPGSDAPIIVGIQIAMIQKLGNVFGLKVSESSAETIIGTTAATMAGRGASQFLSGWVPLAGNIINAGTAALITELLGWIIANDFAKEYSK